MSRASQSNGISILGIVVLVKQYTPVKGTCSWVKEKAQKKSWDHLLFWKNKIPSKLSLYNFFDNFFNSHSSLIVKLYERGLYGIGTARKGRKGMLEMFVDRKMKRGDFEYFYSDKVAWCKWLDRRSVTMLFSNVERMATTSTFPRRQKG